MSSSAGPAERLRGHGSVRTLLLTEGELTAWLLDERTGESRQLNSAAAAVWALLDRPVTVDELVTDLVDTFEMERSQAATIVDDALAMFRESDLLETDDDEEPEVPTPDDDELLQTLTREPDP